MEEKIKQIVAQFQSFEDWMDRYNLLIEMGRNCPVIDEKDKTDTFLIKGCQSRVWIKAEMKEGKIYFSADSDAIITKGIASLLIYVFNGEDPALVANAPLDFLDEIGLKQHLSPTRSNGLTAMIKQIKLYALALSLKK